MLIHQTPIWQQLIAHQQTLAHTHMRDQFAQDPYRFDQMHTTLSGLLFDYSKNRITNETLDLLCQLAHTAQVAEQAQAMQRGDIINTSEQRAVLHTALRLPPHSNTPIYVQGENIVPAAQAALEKALAFADNLLSGAYVGATGKAITDLVHIGIGGSDLGPQMAAIALQPYQQHIQVHFVANADDAVISDVLSQIDAETTLFSIASKSFGTPETLLNAQTARSWFLQQGMPESAICQHFVAISTNHTAVSEFGIDAEHTFPMFDWVGGRYSVWSTIGFPLMVAIGANRFREFLAGAHTADQHFFQTEYRHNIPVLMGLLGIWYSNFHHAESHAVIPYSNRLRRLPAHLQQLDMESNGKHTTLAGEEIPYATGPIIWGEEGVNCQHAFFQLIHQGTRLIPVDFIVPMTTPHRIEEQHRFVVANAFAQAEALMRGKTQAEAHAELSHLTEPYRTELAQQNIFHGNRPSNTFLLDELNPHTLGMIMALYEHKVFVQGAIWGINSFDQWGVEYGKRLARIIMPELKNTTPLSHDSSTNGLIRYFRHCQNPSTRNAI